MIVPFDYDLVGRIGESQSDLIISVNGNSISEDNGFLLVNGKIGTLGVCADGRFQFLPYPSIKPVGGRTAQLANTIDVFNLVTDSSKTITLKYERKNGKLRKL